MNVAMQIHGTFCLYHKAISWEIDLEETHCLNPNTKYLSSIQWADDKWDGWLVLAIPGISVKRYRLHYIGFSHWHLILLNDKVPSGVWFFFFFFSFLSLIFILLSSHSSWPIVVPLHSSQFPLTPPLSPLCTHLVPFREEQALSSEGRDPMGISNFGCLFT